MSAEVSHSGSTPEHTLAHDTEAHTKTSDHHGKAEGDQVSLDLREHSEWADSHLRRNQIHRGIQTAGIEDDVGKYEEDTKA